jgi:hypothetical protein
VAELSEDEYETAKIEFQTAITRFFERVDPGAYISAWLLIAQKDSVELAQAGTSCVEGERLSQ